MSSELIIPSPAELEKIQGVVFDMDDTLVDSQLDFVAIRKAVGAPLGQGIIEYIESLSGTEQEKANDTLRAAEWHGAEQAQWMPGAQELVVELNKRNVPLAILTRNARDISQAMIERLAIPIDTLIAREDCVPKPNPEGLLMVAEQWQLESQKMVYIGDHIYDIEAALAANMKACLFISPRKAGTHKSFYAAHWVVDDLLALKGLGKKL